MSYRLLISFGCVHFFHFDFESNCLASCWHKTRGGMRGWFAQCAAVSVDLVVRSHAGDAAPVPAVFCLEGGYDIEALVESVGAVLEVLVARSDSEQ